MTSRPLSDAHLEAIHDAAVKRLEETGILVEDAETVELLRQAECTIGDKGSVTIRPDLIERAIAQVPRDAALYSQTGALRIQLGGGRVHVGTGLDLPYTMDLVGSNRREAVLADVTAFGRLSEALENLDFVTSMARAPRDQVGVWDRKAFLGLVESTTKPIVYSVQSADAMQDVIRMAEIVAGGAEVLSARPFLMLHIGLEGSLALSRQDMAQIRMVGRKGLPWMFDVGSAPGDEEPDSLDARLIAANARALSVLAVTQICCPGSPLVLGPSAGSGPMEMRFSLGLTELLHRRYDLPVWGQAGVSDSKLPDIQAGIESALSLLAASSSGASLVLGAGSLESGAMGSFEMVVIADEILGNLQDSADRDLERGSSLFDRDTHPVWIESRRPNMIRSARDKAIEVVGSHAPAALPGPIVERLQELVREAEHRLGTERW